jgi:hypothetical protein
VLVWKPLSNYVEKQFMLDIEWQEIKYIPATLKEEPLLIRTDGDIIMYLLSNTASKRLTKHMRLPRPKRQQRTRHMLSKEDKRN